MIMVVPVQSSAAPGGAGAGGLIMVMPVISMADAGGREAPQRTSATSNGYWPISTLGDRVGILQWLSFTVLARRPLHQRASADSDRPHLVPDAKAGRPNVADDAGA